MRAGDVERFVEAWTARDISGLKALAPRIGCVFDVRGLLVLEAVTGWSIADVVVIAEQACREPSGIVMREYGEKYARDKTVVLAWADRERDRITIGAVRMRRAALIGSVWPQLKPWYKEVERNAAHVRAWASLGAPDRVHFKLAELEAAPVEQTTADLVRQIVANPDDLALRAVLADAFLERDDPRGELMRLALEPETQALRERIATLEAQHGPTLAKDVTDHVAAYKLKGGFVDSITLTAPRFVREGAAMLDAQPIREVVIDPVDAKTFATLAKADGLARVRALRLEGDRWRPRAVEVALPRAHILDTLVFYGCRLAGPAFAAIEAPVLAKIAIEHCPIDADAVRSLLALRTLRALELQGSRHYDRDPVDDTGFLDVFGAEPSALATATVRELRFSTDRWCAAFVAHAPGLTDVTFEACGPATAAALVALGGLAALQVWDLPTPAVLATLLTSRTLCKLRLYGDWQQPRRDEADALAEVLLALPASHPLQHVYVANTSHEAALAARFPAS